MTFTRMATPVSFLHAVHPFQLSHARIRVTAGTTMRNAMSQRGGNPFVDMYKITVTIAEC